MARPRAFDPDTALQDVMNVFWKKGYEGASLQDIEAATGLNKQSLYRVFGDKRAMYLAALDIYERNIIAERIAPLVKTDDSAYDRFDTLFTNAITARTVKGDRRGCFLCNASVDQAALDAGTGQKVQAMMGRIVTLFDGALATTPPYDRDPDARRAQAQALLAAFLGLRVLVKAGVEEQALIEAKDAALATLRRVAAA